MRGEHYYWCNTHSGFLIAAGRLYRRFEVKGEEEERESAVDICAFCCPLSDFGFTLSFFKLPVTSILALAAFTIIPF